MGPFSFLVENISILGSYSEDLGFIWAIEQLVSDKTKPILGKRAKGLSLPIDHKLYNFTSSA